MLRDELRLKRAIAIAGNLQRELARLTLNRLRAIAVLAIPGL
jgi:hypothetical protein